MAQESQIYTIVNELAGQVMGQNAIKVIDTSSLIALGGQINATAVSKNAFATNLTNLIGLTVISMRAYNPDTVGTVIHAFEWGVYMRKIYVAMPEAKENNSWNIAQPAYSPQYAPVYVPDINEDIFANLDTFELPVTIPDRLLRGAFRNAEEMALLISAIFLAMDNKISLVLEALIRLTRAGFIARKLISDNKVSSYNLLTNYNKVMAAANQPTLTSISCRTNKDFQRWSSTRITLWRKRMADMTVLFNEKGYERHTPKSDSVLIMHSEYEADVIAFMEADTYHDELVRQTNYATTNFWQGTGDDYSWKDTSSIDIQIDADTVVSASGIVAVLYDYQALGVMMDDIHMVAARNDYDEYTTYANKINRGYFNDMSENGMVFYIADEDYTVQTITSSPSSKTQKVVNKNNGRK